MTLDIPTVISSDDERDTLRNVAETLRRTQRAVDAERFTTREARDQAQEDTLRLGRLIRDVEYQIRNETERESVLRLITRPDQPEEAADTIKQMAQVIVDGWRPPRELADQIMHLLAVRVAS